MWLYIFSWIMGVVVASSQIMVIKIGRSTFEGHNFFMQTLIDTILAPLERSLFVEYEKKICLKNLLEGFRRQHSKLGPIGKNGPKSWFPPLFPLWKHQNSWQRIWWSNPNHTSLFYEALVPKKFYAMMWGNFSSTFSLVYHLSLFGIFPVNPICQISCCISCSFGPLLKNCIFYQLLLRILCQVLHRM